MPVAAPAWDRYGGDRPGDNLFSSSIVAVDAATGKRLWHFQVVHHDIWDLDTQAPPVLLEVERRGRADSGRRHRVEVRLLLPARPPSPASRCSRSRSGACRRAMSPGEQAARTQPIPGEAARRSRAQSFSLSDVATVTPELEASLPRAGSRSSRCRWAGRTCPSASTRRRSPFPGRQGGANWGGGSLRSDARAVLRQREQSGPGGAAASRAKTARMTNCRSRDRPLLRSREEADVPAAAVGHVDRDRRPHRARSLGRARSE